MKDRIFSHLFKLDRQTLTMIYVLLALIAMAVAGGAPGGSNGSIG